ncbi:MAG: methyltransferase [Acidobacteria bacterium]|nr:MAG: methyltransferase [Acidobacteriota bacterium]
MENPNAPARDPSELTFQLAIGYMPASCIHAVTRLKIADLLKDGPRPVSELARLTSTSEDILYRILRALSSTGLFAETTPRTFANTPSSDILREDHPSNVRDLLLWMSDPFHFDTYRDMMPTLRDGKPALEHIHHKNAFEVIFSDPVVTKSFNDGMTALSALVVPAVLEAYSFEGIGTLADIAGGHGMVLTSIAQRYPNMKGILFDLKNVVEGAKDRIQKLGLANRVQSVAGDFFETVPAADAYIMKSIIHDWDDERAIRIIKNCGAHLKKGGKVILVESVLPTGSEPTLGKWVDIEMFMMPGGRERTEPEYRDLFQRAGFVLTRVVPTKSPMSVIEAQKA